LCLHNRKPND